MDIDQRAYATVVEHSSRKSRRDYLAGESPEPQAFGLLAGHHIDPGCAVVTDAYPLARNARDDPRFRQAVDAALALDIVRSETSLPRRGWVADPSELLSVFEHCDQRGISLLGSYHTHHVPWPDNPLRDTCSEFDRQLAAGQELWVMIVSMVLPDRPIVRVFFEADNAQEAEVSVGYGRRAAATT